MGEWKRLFYYLLLNVIVSAITTMAVLIVWDRMHASEIDFMKLFSMNSNEPVAVSILPTRGAPLPAISQTVEVQEIPPLTTQISPENTTNVPQVTSTSSGQVQVSEGAQVMIESIVGAGDLLSERVMVKRVGGDNELSLANWQIKGNGKTYTFPQLTLFKGGGVNVHTSAGRDTVIDLYWGMNEPSWKSGSVVTLVDAQGNVQTTYKIP